MVSEAPGDPDTVYRSLWQMGLLDSGERPPLHPLTGGVSSDIVRVDLPDGPVCVKRALPRLKVAQPWHAPVARNAFEAAWMRTVAEIAPDAVVPLRGEDSSAGLFVMDYLPPDDYPVWKSELRDGRIDADFAAELGRLIARIHGATAGRADVAERFAGTERLFDALRLEPYFMATARLHPDRSEVLQALAARTAQTRVALIHGDLSPKNVLVGPRGPVLLDAEACTWGDPAFDVAFCLSHLLLKCAWRPQWTGRYLNAARRFLGAYSLAVPWVDSAEVEARTASLLPALLLARIDGKSPVEYLTAAGDQDRVRTVAGRLLDAGSSRPAEVIEAWEGEWQG